MSVRIDFELPEEVFSTFRQTPEEFVREMRLASAVSRREFLAALDRFGITPSRS